MQSFIQKKKKKSVIFFQNFQKQDFKETKALLNAVHI